jgi:flagellar biosynthesis protein FlhB
MSDQGQRTEQPTEKRLQKSREEGQFLAARDFVSAVQFVAVAALVVSAGPKWIASMQDLFAALLRTAFDRDLQVSHLVSITRTVLATAFVPLALAGGLLSGIALATQLALSGVGFSLKALSPKLSRINPMKKLGDIGGQFFATAAHALLLFAALSLTAYWLISGLMPQMLTLPLTTIHAGTAIIGAAIGSLLWKCALVLAIFGAIDLFRQKRKLGSQLRMTKQEIRQEMKENEGNPHMKSHIRRLRRQLLRGRMMSAVPTATAIIVNPTHFAVAIKYDPETMASPVVVAKGKNYLAKLIREKAMKYQVPIVENPPLARALYGSAEVGQQIPLEFYRAVAEILAYLYKMMNRRA